MALVVEDGTGKNNAESYISVADATTYVQSFYLSTSSQYTKWAAAAQSPGTQAEVALRRATRDIDVTYGPVFDSTPLGDEQALEFPRQDSTVPVSLKNATVELALLVLAGVDIIGPDGNAGSIETITQKLGPLEKSVTYFEAEDVNTDAATKVETLLTPLFSASKSSASINVPLVRG